MPRAAWRAPALTSLAAPENPLARAQNHLIELLPRSARLHLLARCEPVELVLSQTLCEPGATTRHAYFPTQGFVSLVAASEGHAELEVGMVGHEGMLGAQLALGVATTPLRAPGARLGHGLAHRQRCLARRAGRQHGPAARAQPLRLRTDGAVCRSRHLSALSPHRPTPGALAADEPGPRTLRPLPCDARVPGLHARRAPCRHHRRGRRAAKQRTHRIPPRRPEGPGPGRPGSRSVQLLRQGSAAPTANCWADASRAPTAPRPHPDPQGSRPFVHHKSLRRLGLVSVLRQPRRTACPRLR